MRSFNDEGGGSAAFYSWFYDLRGGWGPPYPETTGYIIPTLLNYARRYHDVEARNTALKAADWLVGLQHEKGWLPGGLWKGRRHARPSVFNTGQMMLGLLAAYDETRDEKYLDCAVRASRWLCSIFDHKQRVWLQGAYIDGFVPAYYSRVAWPLLEVWRLTETTEFREVADSSLATIASWRRPNGVIANWGFKNGAPAFTHTIAYTVRGFWEAGRVLGADGSQYRRLATETADLFRRRFELKGALAGAYTDELEGHYWYSCLTGDAQFAIIWSKIAASCEDARFLSASLKILNKVALAQGRLPLSPTRGAIPGSRPFYGRYLFLRYPNWATKFFLDALILNIDRLESMLESVV